MRIIRDSATDRLRYGWVVLALFVGIGALLGGSSRPDAIQTAALRPLAAVFLGFAMYHCTPAALRKARYPLMLLALLALWMAIQLIPLPPAIWRAIPGTEPVAALTDALGQGESWRPLSFVPFRTLNALFSLVVPLTALVLPLALGVRRSTILQIIVWLAVTCALLGTLQILGGQGSALYFYEHVNRGSPVGWLANRNHAAVFLSLALLTAGYLLFDQPQRRAHPAYRIGLLSAALVIFMVALASGSRAGFVTTLVALGACMVLFLIGSAQKPVPTKPAKPPQPRRMALLKSRGVAVGAALVLILLAATLAAAGRVPAMERLFAGGPWEDLRWSVLPVLFEMIQTYFLLGTGFGSFEEVYHIHEPLELLLPTYLNMAHNDWAQFIIESGVPGLAILAGLLVWIVGGIRLLASGGTSAGRASAIYWTGVFAIIALASLADYPLRAPLFQLVTAMIIAAFCLDRRYSSDAEP